MSWEGDCVCARDCEVILGLFNFDADVKKVRALSNVKTDFAERKT